MKWLLNLFSYKIFFLKNYFNWVNLNSYFTFTHWLSDNFLKTFFFNFYIFNCEKIVINDFNNLKTINIAFIKKKLFYYFFLTQTQTPINWVYVNIGLQKIFNTNSIKMSYFFFYEIKNFINMLANLIKYGYAFLFVSFDILKYEIASFSKYVFGITTYIEYPYVFDISRFNLRSHVVKFYFVTFLVQKNIKLLIFLNYEHNFFYINFFKQPDVIMFGLISNNMSVKSLDYWLFTKQNDFVSNYLLFSLVFSVYNKLLFEQQSHTLSLYNYSFLKILKV